MHDAAVEKIGDGRKPDMGMRANVHASAGDELHRSDLIEEYERTNHLTSATVASLQELCAAVRNCRCVGRLIKCRCTLNVL